MSCQRVYVETSTHYERFHHVPVHYPPNRRLHCRYCPNSYRRHTLSRVLRRRLRVSNSSHRRPSRAYRPSNTQATLKDAPSGCAFQGDLECADNMTDLLAKDAFNAYATGSELSYKETLTGFMSTYLRTIPSNGQFDPANEIAIPSQVFPRTFHVFRISK